MTNMTAKISTNYDEATINDIVSAYSSAPARFTVDALAQKHNKSARSVIAKLSALGVYVKPVPVTESKVLKVTKETYIRQIQDVLKVELASLEKMNKADLEVLREVIGDCTTDGV